MSSKRRENYRRTTKRLLSEDRARSTAMTTLLSLNPVQRVRCAVGLLLSVNAELAQDSDLKMPAESCWRELMGLEEKLSQRAVAESRVSTFAPRAMETPAAGLAPSAGPAAAISQPTPNPSKEGNKKGSGTATSL